MLFHFEEFETEVGKIFLSGCLTTFSSAPAELKEVIFIFSHSQPIPCPSLPAVLLLPAVNIYMAT